MPSSIRPWLRDNPWRGQGKTTRTSKTDLNSVPTPPFSIRPECVLPLQPPKYEKCTSQLSRFPGGRVTTILPPAAPPPFSDQAMLPFLGANLRRQGQERILLILDYVMISMNDGLADRGNDAKTAAAIAKAVREDTLAAAVTVRKSFLDIPMGNLNDDVDEGCRKVVEAVIAATAAAPKGSSKMGMARSAASMAAHNKKDDLVPYAVAAQLGLTVKGVAAEISVRVINGNRSLRNITLTPRSKFR